MYGMCFVNRFIKAFMSAKNLHDQHLCARVNATALGGRLLGDAHFRRLDWFLGGNIYRSMPNESIACTTPLLKHMCLHIILILKYLYIHRNICLRQHEYFRTTTCRLLRPTNGWLVGSMRDVKGQQPIPA